MTLTRGGGKTGSKDLLEVTIVEGVPMAALTSGKKVGPEKTAESEGEEAEVERESEGDLEFGKSKNVPKGAYLRRSGRVSVGGTTRRTGLKSFVVQVNLRLRWY